MVYEGKKQIEMYHTWGRYWWVSKNSQDAAGKEWDTEGEAIKDAYKRFGSGNVVFQRERPVTAKKVYEDDAEL